MAVSCRLADIQNVAANEQRRKVSANSRHSRGWKKKKREEKKEKERKERYNVYRRGEWKLGPSREILFIFHVCHLGSINSLEGRDCTPAIILIENSRTSLVGSRD